MFFHSRNRRLLHMDDFENEYDDGINGINNQLGKYMGEGSGWQMDSSTSVNLNIAKYNPIRGSSYIETPKRIANKKAVINVKNNDNRCFEYAILASIYPAKDHVDRVGKYVDYIPTLNVKGIEMPMLINDIDKFEKQYTDYMCMDVMKMKKTYIQEE